MLKQANQEHHMNTLKKTNIFRLIIGGIRDYDIRQSQAK
jgi:hypothetical protein